MSEQDEQTRKYDRQLRLWGAHGQAALMGAHILLVGAGPAGTEALKNLVLPGVGHFTVLDGSTVCATDRENNFFVEPGSEGKPRAQVTAELLSEMNEDVKGDYRVADPERLLIDEPEYFAGSGFTLVIATTLRTDALARLSRVLRAASHPVPLLIARAVGLLGYVRLDMAEHTIIEAKPDGEHHDLRLATPFDALRRHADGIDLEHMSHIAEPSERARAHAHVPWATILLKLLVLHRAEHGELAALKPFSKEAQAWKEGFAARIKDASVRYMTAHPPTGASGGGGSGGDDDGAAIAVQPTWGDEVNFVEAVRNAHVAYKDAGIPGDVRALMDDTECSVTALRARVSSLAVASRATAETLKEKSHRAAASADADADSEAQGTSVEGTQFWLMVAALKRFVAAKALVAGGAEALPLPGSLPDMTATTEAYVALQSIYKEEARRDAETFALRVAEVYAEVCSNVDGGGAAEGDASGASVLCAALPLPSAEAMNLFCRNARFLRVMRMTPFWREVAVMPGTGTCSATFDQAYELSGAIGDDLDMSGAMARFEEAWREEQQEEHELDDAAAEALTPPDELTKAAFSRCQTPALYYIGLRAADAFAGRHGRAPGAASGEESSDAQALHAVAVQLFGESEPLREVLPKFTLAHAQEMVRFSDSEVHNIAAVVGGLAAQEAVKLITRQYVPLNNTWLFNGITTSASTVELG